MTTHAFNNVNPDIFHELRVKFCCCSVYHIRKKYKFDANFNRSPSLSETTHSYEREGHRSPEASNKAAADSTDDMQVRLTFRIIPTRLPNTRVTERETGGSPSETLARLYHVLIHQEKKYSAINNNKLLFSKLKP